MYRLFATIAFVLAFAGAAHWVVPGARYAYGLVSAGDDAARIAEVQLERALSEERVSAEISEALAAGDGEMAASFVALADEWAIPVSVDLRAQVATANDTMAKAARGAGAFGAGLITGQAEDLAGFAGAAVGDLTVWGDLRDGGRELINWARGDEVDELMLGLAGVGIVATGATYAAFGAPLTLRAGLSFMKGARRVGAIGTRFAGHLIDAARTGRRAKVAMTVTDLGRTASKAGTRAAVAGLRHVDDAAGAARLARLADVKGVKTLAIVKTLGRGALFVTEAMAKLAFWLLAAVVNTIGLISSFNAMVVAMVRPLWKKKRAAKRPGRFAGFGYAPVRVGSAAVAG